MAESVSRQLVASAHKMGPLGRRLGLGAIAIAAAEQNGGERVGIVGDGAPNGFGSAQRFDGGGKPVGLGE
ncbi:MAG: hypothetical protein CK538_06210 [Opitutia bacterium]|nr:MAG: hypothetical protein CK538_06210 [Opitutae bacterium]